MLDTVPIFGQHFSKQTKQVCLDPNIPSTSYKWLFLYFHLNGLWVVSNTNTYSNLVSLITTQGVTTEWNNHQGSRVYNPYLQSVTTSVPGI